MFYIKKVAKNLDFLTYVKIGVFKNRSI